MADSTTTRRGPTGLRRRRPKQRTWTRLMEDLVGKAETKRLLKEGRVDILTRGRSGLRTFTLHLKEQAVEDGHFYCIHARQSRHYIPADAKQAEGDEHNLSRLYPKVALLLSNPGAFFDKAG